MKAFNKRKHEIGEGSRNDSNLMNGLMPAVLSEQDLNCSVTGKGETQKIDDEKIRLLTGILLYNAKNVKHLY
jgi:hypothetical protein